MIRWYWTKQNLAQGPARFGLHGHRKRNIPVAGKATFKLDRNGFDFGLDRLFSNFEEVAEPLKALGLHLQNRDCA